MTDKTITERQQYWLDHLKAADAGGISLLQYAEANELKVKDPYQWKTSLTKRGFWASSPSSFVAVKAKPSTAVCSMVLPMDASEYDCASCCQPMEAIGEKVSEQLDIIPAQVLVIRHVRKTYACKACESTPKTANLPPQPTPKSMASPG